MVSLLEEVADHELVDLLAVVLEDDALCLVLVHLVLPPESSVQVAGLVLLTQELLRLEHAQRTPRGHLLLAAGDGCLGLDHVLLAVERLLVLVQQHLVLPLFVLQVLVVHLELGL